MIKFYFDNILDSKSAMDLLLDLALYSNYYRHGVTPFISISAVASYLQRQGKTIPTCAKEVRNYSESPKYFYNLIGPTWHGKGAKISIVDGKTGESKEVLDGDGQFNWANYWAKFDQANTDFSRALKTSNHELLLSAFSKGQAAIENYLNTMSIDGIKDASVESKLKKAYLVKNPNANWDDVRELDPWKSFISIKAIRNKQETHNKDGASGFTYNEIHEYFNLFPIGIGSTLFELHRITAEKCPASIIRLKYHPHIQREEDG